MNKYILVLILISLIGVAYFYKKSQIHDETNAFWNSRIESNENDVDHSEWQEILEAYVIEDTETGINYFQYAEFEEDDKVLLEKYITSLSALDPRKYNGNQQQAFWINLYNALTVKLILDNYPLESITKLGKNLTSFGPWDDTATSIAGQTLSLNDIEHRILRRIWSDARVHFAVNCASIGCPNLQATAFTAANLNQLLDKGATDYLAHPRGMHFDGETLVLSKIFDWYGEDFGTNNKEILHQLSLHAPETIKKKLLNHTGAISYEYDWDLNEL